MHCHAAYNLTDTEESDRCRDFVLVNQSGFENEQPKTLDSVVARFTENDG